MNELSEGKLSIKDELLPHANRNSFEMKSKNGNGPKSKSINKPVEIEKDTRIEMGSFVIEGGYSLKGKIKPQGAKNEALQVISSVLLTSEEVLIENIPNIIDVNRLIEILKFIGVKIKKLNLENNS